MTPGDAWPGKADASKHLKKEDAILPLRNNQHLGRGSID